MSDSLSPHRQPRPRSARLRYAAQRNALVELAGLFHGDGAVEETFQRLTTVVASTLQVARVSVWRYDAGRHHIDCLDLYDGARDSHTQAAPLPRATCPAYFEAVRSGEVIVAADARLDPRTSEFAESYLTPLEIFSMLDAPFRVVGEVEGVLCCEHTGARRTWSHDEVTFVAAVAQVLARLIEQLERARVQATSELRSAALNAAIDAVSIVGQRGELVWANDAFATLRLHAPSESSATLGATADAGDRMATALAAVLVDGAVCEREVTWALGATTYVGHRTFSPIRNDRGTITHAVIIERDLTQQRSLEAQLQQAQKMEAVGQLTGGIAHDFNNLLTIIGGHAQLLSSGTVSPALAQQGLGEIVHAAARASALTRQLLAFSRHQQMAPEVLDLNDVIRDIGHLLARAIGEDVTLAFDLAPAGVVARVDRVQFEQVVMNIAVNARAAMSEGGTFHIATDVIGAADLERIALHWPTAPKQDLVRIRFQDTGCGMTAEVRARVFEPFFSTRSRDKGTGLGLSTAHGIVTQSGGTIWVDSTPARGSTFTVYLPRVDAVPTLEVRLPENDSPTGHERILVVEDEPAVRTLTVHLLRGAGYEVLEAASPLEAKRVVAQAPQHLDLLVTDVILPGDSGDVLYRALAEGQPDLRVLFMSGYPRDRGLRQLPVTAGGFLAKPFSPAQLLAAVRETLTATCSDVRGGAAVSGSAMRLG